MNNKSIMSDEDTENETYYETDDSYYDYGSDNSLENNNNNFYEPEEQSLTKYNVVICEIYNPQFHGVTYGEINHHYLTDIRFKKYNYNEIFNLRRVMFRRGSIEIAECFYLPSQECVSILKTFWLKIIQRKWKNILRERKNIIRKRGHPNSLIHREIYGKWPISCLYYPALSGMLSNLSCASF